MPRSISKIFGMNANQVFVHKTLHFTHSASYAAHILCLQNCELHLIFFALLSIFFQFCSTSNIFLKCHMVIFSFLHKRSMQKILCNFQKISLHMLFHIFSPFFLVFCRLYHFFALKKLFDPLTSWETEIYYNFS